MMPLSHLAAVHREPSTVERSQRPTEGLGGSAEQRRVSEPPNLAQEHMDGSHFSALLVAISAALTPVPPSIEIASPVPGPHGADGEAGVSVAVEGESGQIVSEAKADTVTLDPGKTRGLARDFVPRLQRVVDRMWLEQGIRLDLVEGYRSQERQEQLFAQGRSTPGPVVTWTQNSLHTTGSAADLFADGAPLTSDQASILARVAREEGLRTLYPFDSGHIQLDRPGVSADAEGDLGHSSSGSGGAAAGHARPRIAVPARVAPVARPARVARPGGGEDMASAEPMGSKDASTDPLRDVARSDRQSAAERARTAMPEGQERSRTARALPADFGEVSAAQMVVQSGSVYSRLGHGSSGGADFAPGANPTATTAESRGVPEPVDVSQTVYRRLRIPLEGVRGAASLDIRIRPGAVDAAVNLSDPVLAEELRAHLHELRRTLTDQGLEPRDLTVRLTRDPSEGSEQRRRESAEDPERDQTGLSDESPFRNPFTQEEDNALIDR
jgi:hypothetical protein